MWRAFLQFYVNYFLLMNELIIFFIQDYKSICIYLFFNISFICSQNEK